VIFLVFLLLAAGAAGGVGYWYMERRKQLALAPSEADQKILLALAEGTLTPDDLEEIGIDAEAFLAKHRALPPALTHLGKQQVIEEFLATPKGRARLAQGISPPTAQRSQVLQEIQNLMAPRRRFPFVSIQNVTTNGSLSISVSAEGASVYIGSGGSGQSPRPPRSPKPPKPIRSMKPMQPMPPMGYSRDPRVARSHDRVIARWERACERVERLNDQAESRWERACERIDRQNDRAIERWEHRSTSKDAMGDMNLALEEADDAMEAALQDAEDVIDNALDW